MKPYFHLLLLAMIISTGCFAENKLSGISSDRKQLFDNGWKFFLGDSASARLKAFNDKNWRSIDLPHDWSIEGKVNPQNPSGRDGGYFPTGIGWYRKTFQVPAELKGKCISLYFEGVYMNSEVYINGNLLGKYPYGYSSFFYDLTPYIQFGQENVVSVKVDNSSQKNCRWYSGSGIYRHVWLMATNPVHIDLWGVGITTPIVSPKEATVQIKASVSNESDQSKNIVVRSIVSDKNHESVGENQLKIIIPAKSKKEVTLSVPVSNPLLWSPENPNLYAASVNLYVEGISLDESKSTFGIRSLKFTSDNGFQLNGKTIKISGGCVHHDNGCLGAAAFDRAEERRVELLKTAGFNTVRTSHNPPSEAFLAACDRLGIMVIDEAFDGWREKKNDYDYSIYFDEWCRKDIQAMALRDRNHPSIIMWSIGNEIYERKKPEAVTTAHLLASSIKEIDNTRPITSAMTTWDDGWSIFDPLMAEHDVCGYNYQLQRAKSDHERVPSRVILQTESYPRDAFANWKLVHDNNYIIGDVVWTAIDYLGESGIGRWYYTGDTPGEHWEKELFPWHGAYCGDVDLNGWRKPISHYRNLLWNSTEKLYLAVKEPNPLPLEIKETLWSVWPTWESWTWPGYEGKSIQAEVYSKYDTVRVYLNNKLIGEKPTGLNEQYKATFSIPYASGTLKASGVKAGKEIETTELHTAGNVAAIKLIPDRKVLLPNGQDLSFISIELTDKDGIFQPNATNRLYFKVEGPAVIAGFDNGDIKDVDPYVGNTRKAWHGRALLVIRSTHDAGTIKVTVSSSGLPDAIGNLSAVAN